MANRTRNTHLHIYLSDDEDRILNAKFKASGVRSKSEYIRQLITDGFVYHIDFAEIHRYNFLLSNISNNVNQIAHAVNSGYIYDAVDLTNVRKELGNIWRSLNSLPRVVR